MEMNMIMKLGTFFDERETLDKEYKEFCFKDNPFHSFTKKDVTNIVEFGLLPSKFNNIVLFNIKEYITEYFCKYASSLHNQCIFNAMNLYIGIDDNGEITGIPFIGELYTYISLIRKWIKQNISKNMPDFCCLDYDVNIERTTIDFDILDHSHLHNVLSKYKKCHLRYLQEYQQYVKIKKKWIEDIELYKGKLETVYTNKKLNAEFIEYLKQKKVYNVFSEQINKEFISKDIKNDKYDETNITYWIINFKEDIVNRLLNEKPAQPNYPRYLNIKNCLLRQLTNLRSNMISHNTHLNYYVITFNFKKHKNCKEQISYYDIKKRKFVYLRRCLVKNTPHSINM